MQVIKEWTTPALSEGGVDIVVRWYTATEYVEVVQDDCSIRELRIPAGAAIDDFVIELLRVLEREHARETIQAVAEGLDGDAS